jgi:hypothetical protein
VVLASKRRVSQWVNVYLICVFCWRYSSDHNLIHCSPFEFLYPDSLKPVNLNAKYTLHFTCGINPLNTELNPICHLLALLGAHHIFHVSGLRVKHGRGHLILLLHFSVIGFLISSRYLCAESRGTTPFA